MARLWRNYTDIPDTEVRAIYEAVLPPGLPAHDVRISNSARGFRGRAYAKGSGYHASARPFVVCAIPTTERVARTRMVTRHKGGYLPMAIGSRREALVVVLAHELRHLWQGKSVGNPRGMVYGAKGRYSERDADAYALRMLRRYRRGELFT
jgi:hypothetical protein